MSNCLSRDDPVLDSTFTPKFHPSQEELAFDDFILAPAQSLASSSPLQEEFSRLASLHDLSLTPTSQLTSLESPSSRLSLKCSLGHRCQLSLSELSQGCLRCASTFAQCQQFVKGLGGSIKNVRFAPVLNVQCVLGHEFLINYKSLSRKWCSICRKMKASTQKV